MHNMTTATINITLDEQITLMDFMNSMHPADGLATVVLICFYIVIFLIAIVGNSLAMLVLTRLTRSRERLAKNVYLVNLVIADLSGK